MALEDIRINIKVKLAALWVSVMCCFVYGDFFSLMVPGHILTLNSGKMGIGTTTPLKLLCVAVMMTIPASMIYLSLALKAKYSRLLNLVFGTCYILIMILTVATTLERWWLFYDLMGVVEILFLAAICWQAWRWPKTG